MNKDFATKEIVQNIHNKGFKIFVYTVNKPEKIQIMKRWNVDGIFSNYPERVIGSNTQH